ncbi:hypothetical protein ACFLWZ_04805 [Chloroflexota bacterium]
MRIGPLEIATTVIIIIAIIFITRIVRVKPDDTAQSKESSTDITSWRTKNKPERIRNYLKRLGIAFTVAGILFALAGISMFRWAIQGYVWAFTAMVLGFVLLFLSRKK